MAVLVQPFSPVTVSWYEPGVEVVGFCNMEVNPPGPVQAKLGLVADEPPLSTTLVTAQVSVSPEAVAPGGWVLSITMATADLVQPDMLSVTMSV